MIRSDIPLLNGLLVLPERAPHLQGHIVPSSLIMFCNNHFKTLWERDTHTHTHTTQFQNRQRDTHINTNAYTLTPHKSWSPGTWTPKRVLVEHQPRPSPVSTQLEWLVPFKSHQTHFKLFFGYSVKTANAGNTCNASNASNATNVSKTSPSVSRLSRNFVLFGLIRRDSRTAHTW